jgi:ankyrin repeat protein
LPSSLIAILMGTQGWTPLHDAAGEGNVDMCALLLKYAADPAIKVRFRGDINLLPSKG